MKNFETGDLVYIPSEVTIFNDTDTFKLLSPVNLLITGEKKGCYEIFFEDKRWLVERANVYKAG